MSPIITAQHKRFEKYLDELGNAVGHKDRHEPLKAYLIGLSLDCERKNIEQMAGLIDPYHVSARHQSMHHFVTKAPWDDSAILKVGLQRLLQPMIQHGGINAWIVDDTGIPKKGKHSVGVARQYCGKLGKKDNCQNVVSVSIANKNVSIPAAYRLYLPTSWTQDPERCQKVGVPKDIVFQTKWQISLDQIKTMIKEKIPQAPILADAGYGNITEFRDGLSAIPVPYVVSIQGDTSVWPPGKAPLKPKEYCGKGRPAKLLRRDKEHSPTSAKSLAMSLPKSKLKTVTWREGTKGKMSSRFAALRVRPAHHDTRLTEPRPVEWLLIEWPKGASAPTKYLLSTMPEGIPLKELVRLAKMRWRIERDYEELKQEFGLEHFEGRGWVGFHHHGTLCVTAYAFFAAERARFSPLETRTFFQIPEVSEGFRSRGSPSTSC